MMTVPVKINAREFDLFVVLEQDNIDRILKHDPAEIVKTHLGMPWAALRIRNVVIAYLSPEEAKEFPERMKSDPQEGMKWLTRGFRFRPGQGDHDDPYRSLVK